MNLDATFFNFYGFFLILSIIIGVVFYDVFLFKWNVRKIHILILNIMMCIFILSCGLILTIFENFIFNHKFTLGFSSYGGLIGMIISIFLFSKIFKYNKKYLFKIVFLTVPIIYSISKIGCFLTGCCYGIEYKMLGSVIYLDSHAAPINIRLFPIQLVESISFLFIFIYLNFLYKKNNNIIIEMSLVLCGITKFALEFLRSSWTPIFSFTQILSLIFVIIGLYLLLRRWKSAKRSCC